MTFFQPDLFRKTFRPPNELTAPKNALPVSAAGWTVKEIKDNVNSYLGHLVELQSIMNTHSGLGITIDIRGIEASVRGGDLRPVIAFHENSRFGGRIYPNQLKTALDAFEQIIFNDEKSGIILGGMQSGKTGTSLALQFFGPIYYLMKGEKYFPLYLLTSLTSHEQQTIDEFNNFTQFYGMIRFCYKDETLSLDEYDASMRNPDISPLFQLSPTLDTYKAHVLKVYNNRPLETKDFIRRRVHGSTAKNSLSEFIALLAMRGFVPLVMVDESQHGASDNMQKKRKKKGKDGEEIILTEEEIQKDLEDRICVLRSYIETIEGELNAYRPKDNQTKARLVCMSATPWDLNRLAENGTFWMVRQHLPDNYVGFNMYLGEKLDENSTARPPELFNFAEFGEHHGVKNFRFINMTFYKAIEDGTLKYKTFKRWAEKNNYFSMHPRPPGPLDEDAILDSYRRLVYRTVKAMITRLISVNGGLAKNKKDATGICLRIWNNNDLTRKFLNAMDLKPSKIEVVEFYDHTDKSKDISASVKQFLDSRKRPDLPYLIVVTSKARMGDAFPISCETFIDLLNSGSEDSSASTMNTLLQGLAGRACGAGKNSTVCLSPGNVLTLREYVRQMGKLPKAASTHTLSSVSRREKPTKVQIAYHMDDKFDALLNRINREIVDKVVTQNHDKLEVKRQKMGCGTYLPMMKFMEEANLFEYIEQNILKFIGEGEYEYTDGELKIARQYDRVDVDGEIRGFHYPGYDDKGGPCTEGRDGWVFNEFRADTGKRIHGGIISTMHDKPKKSDLDGQVQRTRLGRRLAFQAILTRHDPVTGALLEGKDVPGVKVNRRVSLISLPLAATSTFYGEGNRDPLPVSRHAQRGQFTRELREDVRDAVVADAKPKGGLSDEAIEALRKFVENDTKPERFHA